MEVPVIDKMEFWTGLGGFLVALALARSYYAGAKKASAETAKIEKETENLRDQATKESEDRLYNSVLESIERILEIHTKNASAMESSFARVQNDMEVLREEKERLADMVRELEGENSDQVRTIRMMQERIDHFANMAEKACEACQTKNLPKSN